MILLTSEFSKHISNDVKVYCTPELLGTNILYCKTSSCEFPICRTGKIPIKIVLHGEEPHLLRSDFALELEPVVEKDRVQPLENFEPGELNFAMKTCCNDKNLSMEPTDDFQCVVNCYGDATFHVFLEGNSTTRFEALKNIDFDLAVLEPKLDRRTSLIVEVGGIDATLCNLSIGTAQNANFTFSYNKGDTTVFTVLGDGGIHLIGHMGY